MFLRMVYDEKLAQAAYLFGCQRTGQALLIDPQRDIDRYVLLARRNGLQIVAVAETHIHADFLSGSREFAERTGARVYLSDEGDADWKYQWLDKKSGGGRYDGKLLHDGESFSIGGIEVRAIHTPGHTPEHICFQITDRGSGAGEPMGVVTGDFLFVGDLGRPDLLETAAGQAGAAEPAARRLQATVRRLTEWPDYLQVWPGHGAGSACGKALGAVPQSTVGYEKRFNPAVRAAAEAQRFVDFILAGQPEPPAYFARMKRDNKLGPALLRDLPRPQQHSADDVVSLDSAACIVDTRTWDEFCRGHLPRSLHIPLDGMFPAIAGSYIDPAAQVYLVIDTPRVDEAVRDLLHVGIDRVRGFILPAVLATYVAADRRLLTTSDVDVFASAETLKRSKPFVLDVRSAAEFAEGHIPGARNINYTQLPLRVGEIPRDRPLIVNCRSGGRSSRAVAYLQHLGFDAANLAGGMMMWERAGLPVE
jgi:hydroxyacylglutathione hydrolase